MSSIFELNTLNSPFGNWMQQREQDLEQLRLQEAEDRDNADIVEADPAANPKDPLINDTGLPTSEVPENEEDFYGGEVTNESNRPWLISGVSNSDPADFVWLHSGANSDLMPYVEDQLDGDVDAVWPAGRPIENYYTGEIVTNGAFKLRSHRNTNITGNDQEGFQIYDFTAYYPPNELPEGWQEPDPNAIPLIR